MAAPKPCRTFFEKSSQVVIKEYTNTYKLIAYIHIIYMMTYSCFIDTYRFILYDYTIYVKKIQQGHYTYLVCMS